MDSVALSVLCTVPQRRARGQNNETTNIILTVVLVVHYSATVSGSEMSEVARARPRHGWTAQCAMDTTYINVLATTVYS